MQPLRPLVLILGLAVAVAAQTLTSPSAVVVVGSAVTANFSSSNFTGSPDLLGVNHYNAADNAALLPKLVRNDLISGSDNNNSVVVPNTTIAAYDAALAGGCASGSVCDPTTWGWANNTTMNNLISARSAGERVIATDVWVNPPWNRYLGGDVPQDFNVYEDIVMKFVAHFTPDLLEVWNEPDLATFLTTTGSPYSSSQAAYEDIYYHTAHAIRTGSAVQGIAGNSSLPIGGPVLCCNDLNVWFTPLWNDSRFPSNHSWVNFLSYHSYGNSGPETAVGLDVHSFLAGIGASSTPIYVTEWNTGSSAPCDTLAPNDLSQPGFWGDRLISMMNAFDTGATYFVNDNQTSNSTCALLDSNNNLFAKARVLTLLSVDMALGAGAYQLVPTTATSAVTVAQGATNSAGQPVIVVDNFTGSAVTVNLTFTGLSISGSHTVSVYLVDSGSNTGASPISSGSQTISGGTYTQSVAMTANSVAGVLIN